MTGMSKPVDAGGVLTCSRYSFAPNYYHYCGPDTAGAFGDYVNENYSDGKLTEYLTQFETLYPYLVSIARANRIADPFDPRVVEAYWVGNDLLNQLEQKDMYSVLTDGQNLHKRLDKKSLLWLLPKIDQRAKLHHSFHVFNIFTRTGHHTVGHTVETMDQCRIGWGRVKAATGGKIELISQKLVYEQGQLVFKKAIRPVINPVAEFALEPDDWVSFHWGFVCDKLKLSQVKWLERLTKYHLKLANETL
jgi:hypothetical protein